MELGLCLVLGLVWGVFWALLLQCTDVGRYLAQRRTWLTVVAGVGVDLLILAVLLPANVWLQVVGVIAASAVGIVGRSLRNEWLEFSGLLRGLSGDKDQGPE